MLKTLYMRNKNWLLHDLVVQFVTYIKGRTFKITEPSIYIIDWTSLTYFKGDSG